MANQTCGVALAAKTEFDQLYYSSNSKTKQLASENGMRVAIKPPSSSLIGRPTSSAQGVTRRSHDGYKTGAASTLEEPR
jgi:hypothetical protein